ncbi:hypothetical protein CHS0354_015055 [Potamilus streckersoni]|uniref:Tax1-binding protein 1 n=1 Tax=Potamilus streckersoni TaxID=2493646 RepID=A0AAE0TGE6_9BIVA|nr:hypothetical protein CHS0354_015055 [Potamilus streckersoni]
MKVSISEVGEITMSHSKNQTKSLETDPIVDEVVTFNPMELEARYDRAEFAAVVFQNISEVYPIDAHIECKYTITAIIVPTSRDWVALFKVGWMDPAKDYVYYEWAPMPKDYEIGKESEACILFPSHRMPGDDGEFYQFCYVSSSGQIRGASTPFQFRKPSAADYVEIVDSDSNMLVIQSRTVYLQENLRMVESQKNKLLLTQEMLVKELDQLANHLEETKEELSALQIENDELKNKLKQGEEHILTLNNETSEMVLIQEDQRARIEVLLEEKMILETRVEKLNRELTALQSTLMKYHAQKDDLEGQKKSLEEQVTMYKDHFASYESAAILYGKQLQELQITIAEKDDAMKCLQEKIGKLTREMNLERVSYKTQVIHYKNSVDQVQLLEEKLKNAEDKLSAAEESRGLAAKELEAYKEIHARLTADIEKTKTDNHCLKTKVSDLEKDFQQRATIMKAELQETQENLRSALQDKEYAQMQKSQIQEQLESASTNSSKSESSMSAMKLALAQLNERLERKEKQTNILEKTLRMREKEFALCENDLKREIDDLKEKIYMCGVEYKAILIEKTKAQKKLEKVAEKKKSKMQRAKSEEVQIERTQTSPVASTMKMAKPSAMIEEGAQDENSNNEIQEYMDDFEQKMNMHIEKKEKYKKLYNEEKVKNRDLQLEMTEQLKEKDSEILRLRKKIQDMPLDWDYRLRSLEKCVIEKEAHIEMLNQKLRDSVKEKEALKASASYTSKVPAASSGSSDPSGTHCPDIADIDDVRESMDLLKIINSDIIPSAPSVHEDKYLDAPGEPMKLCPVCNKSFPMDVADLDFENHVMDHVEGICPICRMSKGENMTDDDFMRHVNKHYEDSDVN